MVEKKVEQVSGMYVRTMGQGFASSTKFEARVYLMGMVMDRKTAYSHEEAAQWVSAKILQGGFDRVTIEAVEDGAAGRA